MKIAVCYSGQMRAEYRKNIDRMKKILPDADYFFGTWHNQPKEDFINKVYYEPKSHYHPNQTALRIAIKILKRIRSGEIHENSDFPQRITDTPNPLEALKKECITTIECRIKNRNHTKQHVAHALMVRDFVDVKKYDIVIRARYDAFFQSVLKCHIKEFCDIVYEYHNPIGFHSYNNSATLEGCIKSPVRLQQVWGSSLHDFLIIHRADMFDPYRTLYMYKNKTLGPAEHGWWQILCEPYQVHGIDAEGFAKIGQQHIDHKEWFRKFYPDNRYNFGESLQEIQNDIKHLLN